MAIFTKFDAQIIKEYVQLNDMEDDGDKWYKAKENAEYTFQRVYLPKVMNTGYPPKTYVHLEGGINNIWSFKDIDNYGWKIWICQRQTVMN